MKKILFLFIWVSFNSVCLSYCQSEDYNKFSLDSQMRFVISQSNYEDTLRNLLKDSIKFLEPKMVFPPEILETTKEVFQNQKSLKKAFFLSLVLPGLGEWYAGSKGEGKFFLFIEGGIWTYYGVNKIQGNILRGEYKAFAGLNANTNPDGAPDQYFKDLGLFWSSDSANERIRRDAREQFPDNPQAQQEYINSRIYTGEREWEWRDKNSFRTYKDMRVSSLKAYHRAGYSFGFALLNRLISGIEAIRLTRNLNRELKSGKENIPLHFGFRGDFENNKVSFIISGNF